MDYILLVYQRKSKKEKRKTKENIAIYDHNMTQCQKLDKCKYFAREYFTTPIQSYI